MEALDNPSYFTVPGATHQSKFSLLRRRGMGAASSSTISLSSHISPTNTSVSTKVPHRRSFRSLLRSMSSNSDSAQLLVLGNPRPSDLAPGHRSRRRASSSASELLSKEVSSHDDDDDGEVFLAPGGDVRYYNLTAPRSTAGKRRHSIGTFLHSAPGHIEPAHSMRKRCDKCIEKGGMKSKDLLDIMILSYGHSETAALWVTYLTSCFQQISKEQNRPPFKLVCVKLEDVFLGMTTMTQLDHLAKARLQIIILCPGFLEQINANPGPASVLTTLLQPGRAIVMLLGVSEDTVTIQHRAALLCFDEWRKVVVKDQDPTFVGDFLGVAMDILSRSWQIQQAINQIRNDENKAYFSVIPKKVKVGQSKLIVLLNEPLEVNDKIHITIDKSGQRLEANSVKRRNPYTLQFTMPATCLQVSTLASVFVEKNGKPLGHRPVKCESRMRELDQLLRSSDNPLQFMCQTLGLNPGEKDQLDLFLVAALQRNLPPHFNLLQPAAGHNFHCSNEEYPTILHFAARFGLEKLSWQLLECPGGEQACQLRNACQLTPADMAERAGHARLANALKGYLQMTELSSMYTYLKGISGKQSPGFSEANYLLPRPLNDTYLIPPAARPVITSPVSLSMPTTSISCPSTPISQPSVPFYSNLETYKVPPSRVSSTDSIDCNMPPCPLPLPLESIFEKHPVSSHSASSSPVPTTPSTPKDNLPPGGYLEMHSSGSEVSSVSKHKCHQTCCQQINRDHHNRLIHTASADSISGCHVPECSRTENCRKSSTSSSGSAKHSHHGVQDELVEIINDFKNNVFTIAEVEKLVDSWQNRHDVQQSFKEKQEQLNAMREEYERIQQAMKHQMKRATPFERIRKFFSRGKSKHSTCSEECSRDIRDATDGSTLAGNVCHRPASSLSLRSSCSSGSSGRMSTGSGTSLGDSGTHSDPDDKKTLSNEGNAIPQDLRCKLPINMLYYDIPPSSSEPRLARPPPLTDLTEYVTPDNKSCLGLLCRSTSLTEEDTILEDQENLASNVDDENKFKTCVTSVEDDILQDKDEMDREIAVVEVHPPPLTEIAPTQSFSEKKTSNHCYNDLSMPGLLNHQKINLKKTEELHSKGNEVSFKSFKTEESLHNTSQKINSESSSHPLYRTNNLLPELNENEQLMNYDTNNSNNLCNNINHILLSDYQNDVTDKEQNNDVSAQYEDNSDEESVKETDQLLENLQLHDYINISGHPPPPVPPRGKYSHVTL
ncbi:DBB domain-containing protein stumps isoform X2 [Lycorma delicatula]|uniref:DBB domain-containing protein stumps isoform X2 n=1 Tax=Lycorma delicatula TaxID=130591 RepID=UPI003F516A17